ncbi:GTP binding protein (EngB) [Cordyceps fumosorosea ARSEF 2679]|uniref:GTP binding protein (EngB) n=1 Tax=Cordyceps fumosorosea (strain ARSEF 2679) TaxID=1081104 RepID=A0A162LDI8_CORFA|nr:GTP binding protein (EngB) [Cordyceps fumosorosea ARSEF 2679]OAA69084.1 GTP binding protein (EngB) [Cordyceps fumosorosea ARSEF 2679]
MPQLRLSLVQRQTPLAAAHAASVATRSFLSQRPTRPPLPSPQNSPRVSAAESPAPAPLDSPAAYTSIISHAASPATLTTAVDRTAQAHLTHAAAFFEKDARFLYSAARPRDHPHNPHVPEVVILGASNVGKSTLLNALIGRRGIARTSARPGHTTLMNAYGLGPPAPLPPRPEEESRSTPPPPPPPPRHGLVVVDTPGYGYRSQSTWGDSVVRYLGARTALRGAVVLLAAEKRLTAEDRWLLAALADADVRTLAVLTKADKVAGGEWAARCADKAEEVRRELRKAERGGRSMGWREGEGWSSDVLVTAAGLARMGKASNAAGMGAVRAAILDMAGVAPLEELADEQKPENISYTGKVVSFDDIVWKS